MRLNELEPRWFTFGNCADGVDLRIGLTFWCPHCHKTRLGVQFEPVIDPAGLIAKFGILWSVGNGFTWHRTGDTFDDLTLTPSIDASGSQMQFVGHWHGFITDGNVL